MQEQTEHPQNQVERPEWLRIAGIMLAYGLTFGGIIFVIPWLFSLSESWVLGFLLFAIVVPLFPSAQLILLGKRSADLWTLCKIYVAEFASLSMQFIFLLTTVPFIVIGVFVRLAAAMLVAATLAWLIVGLQQLGINIGSKLSSGDIRILFLVTMGLALFVGVYYGLYTERTLKVPVCQCQ